jgi:dihydropteroate synthase
MEKIESIFRGRQTLFSNGKLVGVSKPLVMGVINVTSDSFFSGSRFRLGYRIARRAEQILTEGGGIIDVGACSTRPGSRPVDEALELKRLTKAFKVIRKRFPDAILSVDTYRSGIARRVVEDFGVNIVNDISAGEMDARMHQTVADLKVPYVVMHMQGTPENMQSNPSYSNVMRELFAYFTEKIEKLKLLGVNDIIIDPGFGFGKTLEHNYTILKNLDAFKIFERPVMIGVSRKSMIYRLLDIDPERSLNGTSVLNTIALLNNASILRVHDVREAVEAIRLVEFLGSQPTIH